jgi:PAS domain S-box-containing protein
VATGKNVFPADHCRIWRLDELSGFPSVKAGRCNEEPALAASQGCQTILLAPIRAGGTIWGALTVGSESGREWQPDEIGFAAEIADQVAHAVSSEELRSSRERYRSFVEMSAEVVWRVEFTEPVSLELPPSEQIAAYFARGYVAECNDAFPRFFGRERREEFIGMPLSQLVGPINERHLCEMRQIVEAGYRVVDLEVRHIVDGRERWALRNATGFFENGCLVQFWGASRDITERKRVEEELRALSARRASTLEQERTRIAREIHDELGQQLTALKFEAAAWESGTRTPAKGHLTRSIDAAIQAVRRIATELRPAILDHFGLVAAIEWMANDFSRRTGIECDCELDSTLQVDTALATTVFRIFQEALTNATRHSEAKLVLVRLASHDGRLELSVQDNGRGFSPGDSSSSLGLIGMRERAKEAGGAVAISGVPGRGTRVVAWFPLAPVETPA